MNTKFSPTLGCPLACAAVFLLGFISPVAAATFTVINTNATGAGSLQQAIFDANTNAGVDTIVFNIASGGLTISPSAALPAITEEVTINGRSQPGYVSAPIIELAGASAGALVDGLKIATSNCVVSALVINRFLGDQIEITNGVNNTVEGCYLGLNRTGALDSSTGQNGVLITNAANNFIGGLDATNRNFISGNNQSGIAIGGNNAVSNSVLGNVIGLNVTNTAVVNGADGLRINAPFTLIGGGAAGARNIISGNTGDGIEVVGPRGTNCVIRGNWIGTDLNGTLDRGNTINGILAAAGAALIGGSAAGEGNVICGNTANGIELNGLSSTNHVILGNFIGANLNGPAPVTNGGDGILITMSSRSNIIGGVLAGEGNTFSFNGDDGISVVAANANTNNTFRGNMIFGNLNSGIDLGAPGVTANDTGDMDVGANQLQNFPVLTSVSNTPAEVVISGTLHSRPSTTYALDFYSSIAPDATFNGEGQSYIGSTNLTTGADSNLTFTVGFPVTIQGRHVTATATDPFGNTSEFSAASASVSFAAGQTFTVVNTNNSGAGSLREAINQANAAATTTGDTIVFAITNLSTTISPASALPSITDPVTIDGYTQPGSSTNTSATIFNGTVLVTISGSSAGSGADGLRFAVGNNTVRGLSIINFPGSAGDGIDFSGGGTNVVTGNLIGVDPVGAALGNAGDGLHFTSSPGNVVGGTSPGDRNVISDNGGQGIDFTGAASTNNLVAGNLVGTGLFGTNDVGNAAAGISFTTGGSNVIGGATIAARNVVSGNGGHGVELNTGCIGTVIQNNYIGVGVGGDTDIGNSTDGVNLGSSYSIRVTDNLLSGNNRYGIEVSGATGTNNLIQGNFIGTDFTGTNAIGNTGHGIHFTTAASRNLVGGAGFGNVIAFNLNNGILVISGDGNAIRANSIHNNGNAVIDLGIDLSPATAVAINDPGDPDNGANLQQNYPVLTAATNTLTETIVVGSFNSAPSTTFTLEFFSNVLPDDSGHGQGQTFLGSTNLATGADSNLNFTVSFPVSPLQGRYITATATDPNGNTSEFSTNVYAISTVAGATYTVVNTNDSGPGSLRQAINEANANISTGDTIAFAITNLSTVIFPATALPTIIDPVTIDGYTQPGSSTNTLSTSFNGNLLVRIDGSSVPSNTDGLKFTIGGNTVRGLVIMDFAGASADGLDFSGGGFNIVEGNLIGLDVDSSDHGNGGDAVHLVGSGNNRIGGTETGQRNVLSGNGSHGVDISGVGSSGNEILGNLIGTTLSGTVQRLNGGGGVLLTTVTNTTIGGPAAGARNLISGNSGHGIEINSSCDNTLVQNNYIGTDATGTLDLGNTSDGIIITSSANTLVLSNLVSGNNSDGVTISGAPARDNVVRANIIGTDATATAPVPNGGNGVFITTARHNTIGGATAAEGNIISGNGNDGIEITGATASNNIVRFNFIGTDPTGALDLGNGAHGILIQTSAHDNTIGGSGNTIAFNAQDGVFVSGGANNAIRHNLFYENGGLAIDLGVNGVTTNDVAVMDADTGANQLQNFPQITNAVISPTNVLISGALDSGASQTFELHFYANYAPDASGHGEAEQYLGSTNLTTDGGGLGNFSADLPVFAAGRYITATATDPFGNTSELAVSYRAASTIPPTNYVVINVNNSGSGSLREAIAVANANLSDSNNEIQFNIPGAGPHAIRPLTPLPALALPTTVAGDTQPGYSSAPLIELDGSLCVGAFADGLRVTGGQSIIRALTINQFSGDGIELSGLSSNQVEACYIGLNAAGTLALSNVLNGILITNSAGNTIGGPAAGQRNFIAGNLQGGVHIGGEASAGNRILNNALGLNPAGQSRPNLYGLWLRAPFNLVGGTNVSERNVISGNTSAGIYANSVTASNNVILGNLIGPDLSGLVSASRQQNGIHIESAPGNLIGGTDAGARNYISGNTNVGIYIANSSARSNVIQGNYIGLNLAGAATPPGSQYGMFLASATLNVIGGNSPAARNVISGNTNFVFGNIEGTGVYITSGSPTNIVRGNYIGTDASGATSIPNRDGVYVGGHGTIVGGSEPGEGNLISGNLQDGIEMQVHTGSIIQGNRIGTDVTGALPLGNGSTLFAGGHGISVVNNTVRAMIGGTNAGAANVIAYNRTHGVSVSDTFTVGGTRDNAIWGNTIFSNALKGISLGSLGPLANDAGDADNGPNRRQNHPVLALALTDTNSSSISGTLNSLVNATFRLEFFNNLTAETNGYGEGQTFIGAMDVTTDGGGNAPFVFNVTPGLVFNHHVTATATDSNRNTSEFSASARVVPWNSVDLGVSIADSPDPNGVGLPLFYTLTITNAGPTNATGVFVTNQLPAGVTFVNATPSQGSAGHSGGVVVCDLGTINSNAAATVTIEITAPFVGTLSNFAMVTSAEFDHTPANNSDSELTTTLAITDVAVTATDSADPVGTGQLLVYTVTVTNQGPSPSTSLVLQQDLAGSVIITDFTLSQGTLNQFGNTLVCDLGGLAAGASATLTVTCIPALVTPIVANSSLTWGDFDPNPTNNSYAENTVITNGPGLLQFTSSAYSSSEQFSSVTLGVERLYGDAGTVGVSAATTDGAAVAGLDYSNTVAAITFTNGETLKHFSVPLMADVLSECNEFFSAYLFNPTGGALIPFATNATVFIFDNDIASSGSVILASATDTNLPLDPGNDNSYSASVSADGRFVAFSSDARNLTAGDNNFATDVFVRDRLTQTTSLASRNWHGGGSANSSSSNPLISGNGRFVVFDSYANDLTLDNDNGNQDVFWRDLQTATTVLLSRNTTGTNGGNDVSHGSDPNRSLISSNGQRIVFSSFATDLSLLADANLSRDVFLHDRATGTNRLLSVKSGGSETGDDESYDPVISGNGAVAAFTSEAGDLSPLTDANASGDVFAQDLAAGTNELISVNLAGTAAAAGYSDAAYLSDSGRFVAFQSDATDLTANDSTSIRDVFWRDRQAGVTALVSVNTNGTAGNQSSTVRGISADGRFVVFSSHASNLVPGDGNFSEDVFVRDMFSNVTALVSVNLGGSAPGNNDSFNAVISGDGSGVAFESRATDLTPATKSGLYTDVFVRDLAGLTTRLVSFRNGSTNAPDADSYDAAISFSGNVTAFTADPVSGGGGEDFAAAAAEPPSGSINYSDVWAHDWPSNTTELVSVAGPSASGNNNAYDPHLSDSGTHLVFVANAENLAPGDTNLTSDVFLFILTNGARTLVSANLGNSGSGNGYSDSPDVSANGRFVAFYSEANDLVTGDENGAGDVFRRDTVAGATTLVSVNTTGTDPGNNYSFDPDITPDGRFIAFETTATDLFANDLNGMIDDIVLRDMASNVVELITINGAGTGSANGYSYDPVISDTGRFVAFESFATNFGPADFNSRWDVYVRDRLLGTNILCSRSLTGTNGGNEDAYDAVISGNGLIVLFYSAATNLVAGDTNNANDIFAYNTTTHTIQLVTVAADGGAANSDSYSYSISEDGRYVAFESFATNLVANDGNGYLADVFLRDLVAGTTTLISANCNNGQSGNSHSYYPVISRDGNFVVFTSSASDLTPGFYYGVEDVFRYERLTGEIALVSQNRFVSGGGNSYSYSPVISGNGGVAAFQSSADNLVLGDNNSADDIFAWSASTGGAQPDLVLDKSASVASIVEYNNFTYTLAVTNYGSAAATGVTVTDTLPAAVSYFSASASQGSVTNSGGTVIASIGSLAIGAGANVVITVTPTNAASATNTAIASSSAADATPANNSDFAIVNITPLAPPPLTATATNGNQLLITWPSSTPNVFAVQTATNLVPVVVWTGATNAIFDNGTVKFVLINIIAGEPERFYRLKK